MSIYDQYIYELMYGGLEKVAMSAEDLYSIYKTKGPKGVADIINKKKGQINGQSVSKLLTAFNIPETEVQNIVTAIPAKLYKGLTVNSSGHRLPTTVNANSAVATHLPVAESKPVSAIRDTSSARAAASQAISDATGASGPSSVSRSINTSAPLSYSVNTPKGAVSVSPKPKQQTVVKPKPAKPVESKKIRAKKKRAVKQLPQARRVITEGTRVPEPLAGVPVADPIVVKKPEMLVSEPPKPVIGSGAAPSAAPIEPVIGSGGGGGHPSPSPKSVVPKSNRNKYLLAAGLAGLAGAGAYAYSRRNKDRD